MKRTLARRTFLRGLGTAIALPFLESALPRVARAAPSTAPLRLLTFHFPIGVNRQSWAPSGTEMNWQLGASQQPLTDLKGDICVITGVSNSGDKSGTAGHTCNIATFLTARDVPQGIKSMGTSADQMIAATLKGTTRFGSLELGTSILNENPNDEPGYDPVLKDHLSWSDGTPLPKEINPSAVFDRLFAGVTSGSSPADQQAAARRRHYGQSVIDAVRADSDALKKRLGKTDNVKLDQYLSALRELELRIGTTATTACTPGARPGPPADIRARVTQMLDLSVLAFACDLTRVITFGYEHTVTERAHPFAGVNEGYHIGVTHNNPGAPYAAVNKWIVEQLAYVLDKMKKTADVTGNLLDNSIVYFASELGEGSSHSASNIPIIVAGKGGGRIASGRLLARDGQGNGNVLYAIMQAFGVNPGTFGNGFTKPVPGLVTL
jgi:hypothetical protein